MRSYSKFLVVGLFLFLGCNLQELSDNKPAPTPDTPTDIKVPADAIYRGLATFSDGGRFDTRHEVAEIVNQLKLAKVLTDGDASKIEDAVGKLANDQKEFTKADAEKLRNLK